MKKYIYLPFLFLFGLILTACDLSEIDSSVKHDEDQKVIKVGLPPSMHNILMERLVKPELEKMGYKVELINFSSLRDSNTALVEGSIDMNAAQHQNYLDVYNKETGNDLVPLVHIPSIGAAIFSMKHQNLDQVTDNQVVAIPNDPSNEANALLFLQELGWITLKPNTNTGTATLLDIQDNKYNLKFKVVLSELMPRMLDEVDFAIMPGGVAWMSKVDPKYILRLQPLSPNLELMVVVKKENLDKPWAQAVKKIYQSEQMKQFIEQDEEAKGRFIWPQG